MKKALLPILGLLLFLVACAPVEKGTISFVSTNSVLHDDLGQALVIINSTFESQKLATVTLDGSAVYECLLMPLTDTSCASVTLAQPGAHTIAATVTKTNGTVVSVQTGVNGRHTPLSTSWLSPLPAVKAKVSWLATPSSLLSWSAWPPSSSSPWEHCSLEEVPKVWVSAPC
jgi:hypothetical protein